MPVGWVAAGAAVAEIGSAALSADAAHDAARTQRAGAADASGVQRDMFNTVNRQQQPFIQSGYGANAELSRLLGIVPQNAQGGPAGTGSGRVGDLVTSRGGVPAVNQELYGSDPAYRQAWDQALATERSSPAWRDQGASTYYARGNDADFARLNDEITRNLSQLDSGGASGGGGSSNWRPTGSGGVTPGLGLSPSSDPRMSNDMMPNGAGGMPPGTGGTGLPSGYLSQTFGPQQFLAGMDPGYQWRLQQGAQGVMNGASAASGSLSGPALKALMEYNQGAASQEFGSAFDRFQTQQGNIFQRLSSVAGMGQSAAAGVGAQGVATAGNIGSNIVGAANAGAAGRIGASNAYGGALSDLGALGYMYASRPRPVG